METEGGETQTDSVVVPSALTSPSYALLLTACECTPPSYALLLTACECTRSLIHPGTPKQSAPDTYI